MPTAAHVLIYTDAAWQALLRAANLTGLTADQIVTNKESADKELPILICAADAAVRGRAKNWQVTGSLMLKTDATDAAGQITAAALAASSATETAFLEAIETIVPIDDRPQPLGDALTAAGIAADKFAANTCMITGCMIGRCSAGFDEDGLWTFSVDFTATVIA